MIPAGYGKCGRTRAVSGGELGSQDLSVAWPKKGKKLKAETLEDLPLSRSVWVGTEIPTIHSNPSMLSVTILL